MNLYELTSAFPALMEKDDITEEDKQEIEKELTEMLKQKTDGIIRYTKNEESIIKAMKEEETRLSTKRKSLERKLETFKNYVKECMEQNGLKKIETDLGNIATAKSPVSVEVVDESKIPDKFIKTEIKTSVDKSKILANFKETGEIIEGVNIRTDKTYVKIG